MGPLKIPVSSSKRRRSSQKTGRRFSTKKEMKKNDSLPHPAVYPRKAKRVQNAMRGMASVALFFIFLSTMSSWRSRTAKRRVSYVSGRNANSGEPKTSRFSFSFRRWQSEKAQANGSRTLKYDSRDDEGGATTESAETANRTTIAEIDTEKDETEHDKIHGETRAIDKNSSGSTSSSRQALNLSFGTSDEGQAEDKPAVLEELPERIEWYSRDDYKDGTRPMCRISKPYILSNGTILVPNWMRDYEKLLNRCGLGTHSYYTSQKRPEGLESIQDVGADFVLTIHPERFQEPTHVASVYLTEHILKSSYLFDVFGGDAQHVEGVKEHHCYTSEKDSTCALPRPVHTILKPAIFVPKRIENGPSALWSRQLLDMLGKAHGHGQDLIHLNASTVLLKKHKGESENLIGTGFRSIMTTDGMFRHLPTNALQHSNMYSLKNRIDKSPKEREVNGACAITIGIASSHERDGGIQGVDDLREKIEAVSKLAIPGSAVEAKSIIFSSEGSLQDHIKEMQQLDIFVGGSGGEMSSMGFLRSKSVAIELMPFGIKPNTHESMARALGIGYKNIRGKPQDSFKSCLEGEIFNLRKKGTLSYTELPDWEAPTVKAWDAAVGEFLLSGSSAFDILKAQRPVNNYYARVCAQKQNIEVAIDETARKIAAMAKEKCTGR